MIVCVVGIFSGSFVWPSSDGVSPERKSNEDLGERVCPSAGDEGL